MDSMNMEKRRYIASGAARGIMRLNGINPYTASADDALKVLDDLGKDGKQADTVASQWYIHATETQVKMFIREWNQWLKNHEQNRKKTFTNIASLAHD